MKLILKECALCYIKIGRCKVQSQVSVSAKGSFNAHSLNLQAMCLRHDRLDVIMAA